MGVAGRFWPAGEGMLPKRRMVCMSKRELGDRTVGPRPLEQAQGWSAAPPAQVTMDHARPRQSSKQMAPGISRSLAARFSAAEYQLDSAVLPGVIETVPFAERIRSHLMGIHKNVIGGDPEAVSPLFSGKSPDGGPAEGHRHVFIWPMDQDKDGRIDRLLVKSSQPFEASELTALDRLRSVWQPDGRPDAELVLVSLAKEPAGVSSKHWVSATPFVTRRHHRKGRGTYQEWLAGEIRRECEIHGLPEPAEIEFIDHTVTGGHALRWMEFVRSRKGSRPLQGHGCRLRFDEAVKGPFALGALCHFGLGVFGVEDEGGKATQWARLSEDSVQ
jgi:CRISPR-associated protein Csb2